MHPAIARAMKWGAIQDLHAPLVRRALSSIVSLRSTILQRSPGRKLLSHAYLRLRSTFHPADSQHYRGDHDQDPRLQTADTQSQTGPTQPLRQAGSFINRRAAQQLN